MGLKYVAYEYAKRGACLALVARREDRLRAVADRARKLGSPEVVVVRADISKVEECKQFVDEIVNHFGRCKCLIFCFHDVLTQMTHSFPCKSKVKDYVVNSRPIECMCI